MDDDKYELKHLVRRFGYTNDLDIRESDTSPIATRFKPYKGAYTAFLRIFLPDFLDSIDWVIWADVDTLWFRDICRLWEERDDTVSLAWCHDLPSIRKGVKEYSKWYPNMDENQYGCSGVMLMNLKRLRERELVRRASDFAAKWGTPFFVDQDVLNFCCYEDTKFLDNRWDCLNPDPNWKDGIVLHFNGLGAHFNDESFSGWRPLYEIWFRYYAQVVEGLPSARVAPVLKIWFWNLLGIFYVSRKIVACLPLGDFKIDIIHRTLFFSWLRKKALW